MKASISKFYTLPSLIPGTLQCITIRTLANTTDKRKLDTTTPTMLATLYLPMHPVYVAFPTIQPLCSLPTLLFLFLSLSSSRPYILPCLHCFLPLAASPLLSVQHVISFELPHWPSCNGDIVLAPKTLVSPWSAFEVLCMLTQTRWTLIMLNSASKLSHF